MDDQLDNITRLATQDLKLGEFDHADAGQMHLYLNYAKEHWTVPGENAPVGLILCSAKDEAIVKYRQVRARRTREQGPYCRVSDGASR